MEKNSENKYKSLSYQIEKFTSDNIGSICQPRLKTGFSQLDTVLGGGIGPGITVIGAISGIGKSTFSLQMAENVSMSGIPVLYFSLEMPSVRIAAKSICRQVFIDSEFDKKRAINADSLTNTEFTKKINAETWKRINKARIIVEEKSQKLYIIERKDGMLSAAMISNIVKNFIKDQKERPLVFVDYLQILPPNDTNFRGSDKQNVDESIRQMTELAISEDISVVLISSLNRDGYKNPVQLESFKETGSIEYSADVVLGLQFCEAGKKDFNLDEEKSKSPRQVEIVALKQRYGKSGLISATKFNYYAEFDYFQDVNQKIKKNTAFSDLPKQRH